MTARPLTIRPVQHDDGAARREDGRRQLSGLVVPAKLDGVPLTVVAVDGSTFADPVARAEHAVRVLLRYRRSVSAETAGAAAA
jgi:hypothetical protein